MARPLAVLSTTLVVSLASVSMAMAAPTWKEEAKLQPKGSGLGDSFGQAVAVSGTRAIVGATYFSGGAGPGAAFVFERTGAGLGEVLRLAPSGLATNDVFGRAVSLRNDRAVVGAPAHATKGAAWTFLRGATGFAFETKLAPSGAATSFGAALSNDGDDVLVGAPGGAGAASVFSKSGSTWTEAPLSEPSGGTADGFGRAVALRGNLALVGAPARGAGAVFVFRRTGAAWSMTATLAAADAAAGDEFGASIAIDGAAGAETVVVGAPKKNAVYVFGDAGLIQKARLAGTTVATGDAFGESVAISGDRIAVTAPFHAGTKGAVYVFARSGATTFTQEAELAASDGAANDRFGTGLGLDGASLLVGAPTHSLFTGATYAYRLGIPQGEPCGDSSACATSHCVDGVCCDKACDGTCEACTAALRGVGAGAGVCGPIAAGKPASECGPCGDARIGTCDGKGACTAEKSACPGNFACASTTACATTCGRDSDCATGFRCEAGACTPSKANCSTDGKSSTGPDGRVTDCGPFACGSTGECLTVCTGTAQCQPGAICDGARCVVAPAADSSGGDGGCSLVVAPSRQAGAWLVLLLVLGRLRRARPFRAVSSSSSSARRSQSAG